MYKKYDKNLLRDLESLGLSAKEAAVYCALIERGDPTGTTKLIRATELYGQYVYDALAGLEAKGLAKHAIIRGRKKFSANAPSRIVHLAEEKRAIAERTADRLALLARFPAPPQSFEVYEGDAAFTRRLFDALREVPEGGEILVVSTRWGDLFTESRPDFFYDYEAARGSRKVRVRFIVNEGLREVVERAQRERFGVDYRVLPEHQSVSGIYVYPESVEFCMFGDPVLSFSFRSRAVAEGYRNFFETLWSLGKQ